jgi:N-methylhydantoinase B
VKAIPIEVVEHGAPIVVWRKELLPDSGGAGRYRGGLGVVIEVGARHAAPMSLLAIFERMDNVAQGRAGGRPGGRGRAYLQSGRELRGKGLQAIPAGERLVLETPGGAGYGVPRDRDPVELQRDVKFGLVSSQAAISEYGMPATEPEVE